jgi:hypothetical protein
MDEKKESDEYELISLRGDRDIWLDFTHKIRKNKKKVWEILEPMLKEYIQNEARIKNNGN